MESLNSNRLCICGILCGLVLILCAGLFIYYVKNAPVVGGDSASEEKVLEQPLKEEVEIKKEALDGFRPF